MLLSAMIAPAARERANLRGPVLRIAVGAADVADRHELAPCARCRALRVRAARRRVVGRARMRPVAEHDVEQQDRRERQGRRPASRIAALRSDGSIIGCGRPRVYSSSPMSMKT